MNKVQELAAALKNGEWVERSEQSFTDALRTEADVESLMKLAEEYTPYTRVSVPIYRRVLQLDSDNLKAVIMLGWVLWLAGEDDMSMEQLERAKELDAEHVEVLTLEANLTKDAEAKVNLYKKILAKDPENRIAKENLEQMGISGAS